MTQSIIHNIVNGPSKFSLMVSLFQGDSTQRQEIKFELSDKRIATVKIDTIQREDGSGESWNWEGRGNYGEGRVGFPLKGYFNTGNRKGTLRIITT